MYLDHNATTPLLPAAREALLCALDGAWGNPSSPHGMGRRAAAGLAVARRQVAALASWDPRGVTFVSCATEANALALQGLVTADQPLRVVSAVEHPSVLAWGDVLVDVDLNGVIDLDHLDRILRNHRDRVAVVSVMAANNETGVLQPVGDVGRCAAKHGVPFHCDASQMPGKLALTISADMLTLSSHKMGGPRGAGGLLIQPALTPRMVPLLRGGPQERGLRGGTEDVAAIAGFGAACQATVASHSSERRDTLEDAAIKLGGRVVGGGAERLPNTTTLLFDYPGDLIVMALDLAGIQASTGAACSSGAAAESHVLRAMGLAGVPVRFSLGVDDTPVGPAIDVLAQVLARMEATCGS